jgi:oxygen-dependent protoporphyrinogen oxidase
MHSDIKLLIIGGGIAGLSAAYTAAQQIPGSSIVLLEADDRWGGKILTDRVPLGDGQLIIEGGPDTFLATKPWAVALCEQLGLAERLHGTNPHQKNTYVLRRSRLSPLPDGLAMMIPTNVPAILKSNLVSWPGKFRMGVDFILPPRSPNGDETLGGFVSRRLGREAYENLIEPLMSGIYAGDGDALSLASTFPYLRDLEIKYGSLARGALEMRKKMPAAPGSRSAFLTPTTGLAEIVDVLVHTLSAQKVNLRLRAPVEQVIHTPTSRIALLESGERISAQAIILATPAFVTARLLRETAPNLAAALNQIPYVSTATISLAFRVQDVPRPLDGYGYVIPRREGRQALACTWTSTKFPHRAPPGYALIRVFVGRAGQESGIPRAEEALIATARHELRQTLGITAQPLLSRVYIWENAMPQYNLGHQDVLQAIAANLGALPGLALAGNGYRGIGIPDCIHSGQKAVETVLAAVHQPASLP